MTIIVAPFLINCWLEFGDPFYAINVHADVYRETEGQSVEVSQGVADYLQDTIRRSPVGTLDTLALGLTSYPFLNKWSGFDPWNPALGTLRSWASIMGLVLFVGSAAGRLLLLVLGASLLPYAFTWKLIADWRFTEHAYPFLLIASFLAISRVVTTATRWRSVRMWDDRARIASWIAVVACLAVGAWTVTRTLPSLAVREALGDDQDVTIMVGDRDEPFFGEGWSRPVRSTGVPRRVTSSALSDVWLPLPRVQDYNITVRLDPFPTPLPGVPYRLPTVRAFLNGQPLARLSLGWNPDRFGDYDIALPRELVEPGFNRLALMSEPGASPGVTAPSSLEMNARAPRVALWYVRVRPGRQKR